MIRTFLLSVLTICSLLITPFVFANASSIDFVSLEANSSEKVIHFKWNVNSETQGDHFFIEKSINGEEWELVTTVPSIGDHNDPHTYMISKINQAEGANELFRIQRVDKFGSRAVMDQVNINHPALVNIYLIPATKATKKQVIVSYNSLLNSRGSITVLNQHGDIVNEKKVHISEGYNRLVIDTKAFEKGVYKVVLQDQFQNVLSKEYIHGRKVGKTKF